MIISKTQADLHARMAPTAEQVAACAGREAYVAIAFPGKEHGWWTLETRVEHPPGVFANRDEACVAAARHLGEEPGTVGFAWVHPSGEWSVFEDILDPPTHLRFAEAERRS